MGRLRGGHALLSQGRSVDPEAAQRLRELFATTAAPPYRRPVPLLATLAAVAAIIAVSMPLPWHRRFIIGAGYTVTLGIGTASWLLVLVSVLLALAVRIATRRLRGYQVALLLAVTLITMIGVYADWADNYVQAAAAGRPPYYGAGFFLALLAIVGMIAATSISWRVAARG